MFYKDDEKEKGMLTCACEYDSALHGFIEFICWDSKVITNLSCTVWSPLRSRLSQAWNILLGRRVEFDVLITYEDLIQLGEWAQRMKIKTDPPPMTKQEKKAIETALQNLFTKKKARDKNILPPIVIP